MSATAQRPPAAGRATESAARPAPSRLLRGDVLAVGAIGLRTRRLRAALSAVGIAIGIASMVAVLGLSASSQAALLDQIDALGTNLLTAEPGQSFVTGSDTTLPRSAPAMARGMPGAESATALLSVPGANVRRTRLVDEQRTSGITVYGAERSLPRTLGVGLRSGSFLGRASERFGGVVLGAVAARRLGVTDMSSRPSVWIAGRNVAVVGVLEPVALDGALDRGAFVGTRFAQELATAGEDVTPAKVYVRADPDRLESVRSRLGATVAPQAASEVEVSRPSDALEARAAAAGAFTSLLLGLGVVALLVGGVGIANVMVISVLERRAEIGLRRALGATRRHVRTQFLCESLLLSAAGGVAGAALGAAVTVAYATAEDQRVVVPPEALVGGVAAALAIGALAGLYPAVRAARLSPTEALRTV